MQCEYHQYALQRKWADEEMIADLEQLTTAIASKIEERSR